MRCIVTAAGSAGDFLPPLGVAAALKRRGHQVRFVANPFYESRVRGLGLDFIPAGDRTELYDRIEKQPEYLDPSHATTLIKELLIPNTTAVYHAVEEVLRREPIDVVVVNNISLGILWKAAEHRVPSVLIHASPIAWMSWRAPVVLGDRVPPRLLLRTITALVRFLVARFLGGPMRRLARELGSTVPDPSFNGTERLAAAELGLWSPTLRGPIPGDPANGTICGFVRAAGLGAASPGLAPEIEAFLAAGPPPVVVGLGSIYSLLPGTLLRDIAHACESLGQRCLIIGHRSDDTFPSNTLAVRYAPYDLVFPRASVVIGHGGAGTTGEALRSGRPVICVPFAFDQFAFAWQVEQLGVGVRLPKSRRRPGDLRKILARVLGDTGLHARAAQARAAFSTERDGADVGAEAIERLVARRPALLSA